MTDKECYKCKTTEDLSYEHMEGNWVCDECWKTYASDMSIERNGVDLTK